MLPVGHQQTFPLVLRIRAGRGLKSRLSRFGLVDCIAFHETLGAG